MEFLFCGDPHGAFDQIIAAVEQSAPDAVVLLGDCELTRPLEEELAAIVAAGIPILWVHGNHEGDTPQHHDYLFQSSLDGALHSRVVTVNGVRLAGIGGVFRGKVWNPEVDAVPIYHSPADMLAALPPHHRWRGGLPLRHRTSIFPSDFEILSGQKVDILVTHEAPSCHANGQRAIDALAEHVGARLVVHGHHHHRYAGRTLTGIAVYGIELAGVRRVRWPLPFLGECP